MVNATMPATTNPRNSSREPAVSSIPSTSLIILPKNTQKYTGSNSHDKRAHPGAFLFMICFVSVYLETPVYLFQKNHSHHLVRESHPGEAQLEICPAAYLRAQSKAAPDHESYVAFSHDSKIVYFSSQFFRR